MKTSTTYPKLEKATLTAWSLMNSGRNIVTRVGSFPFLRGPTRFRRFSLISDLLKQHWNSAPASFSFTVFDPKTKTNFEGETFYRALIPVTPSGSRMEKTSDSRIFFRVSSEHTKWPSRDLSLIWTEWFSSRDLYQTPLVREVESCSPVLMICQCTISWCVKFLQSWLLPGSSAREVSLLALAKLRKNSCWSQLSQVSTNLRENFANHQAQ